jgi:quercetin dioxygenase-like cupin family protein
MSYTVEKAEFDHSKVFDLAETLGCVPASVLVKPIIKKPSGYINAVSIDSGEATAVNTSAFDIFIHAIDGKAEVVINGIPYVLQTGQSIIIPAHSHNTIKAMEKFKMLSAIIKSGYEE